MEDLIFRKPMILDCAEIMAFKDDFLKAGSGMDGTGILFRADARQWLDYIDALESPQDANGVPCFQYGLFCPEGTLLGMLQIRIELKGYLVDYGGHIGYCVRPSERRKGYAKYMLQQSLYICRKMGLQRVLVTCLEDNLGSEKTIKACGGVFECTVFDDINYKANMKRYWIDLNKSEEKV